MAEIENGKVSMAGWLPSGRRVYFEQPSWGDLQRDISLAIEMDRLMSAAGLLPRESGVGEGEKSETVNYVLRTISESSKGESDRIYLYTERFNHKFLAVYLNNQEQIEAFERACGVVLDRLPIYEGQGHIERGKNARLDAQYIVKCRPTQAIYKQNPRWKPDLDEEARKKIPKHQFVKWGARADDPAQSPHPGGQTDGQTPPGPSDNRLSKQTDSRQTNQTRRMAQTDGQTDRIDNRQKKMMAENSHTRIETTSFIYRDHVRGNQYVITTDGGSYSYTRDPFKAVIEIGDKQTGRIALGKACNIISEKRTPKTGGEFWEIKRVEPMGEAEAAFFGPEAANGAPSYDPRFGPPPEADFGDSEEAEDFA